MASGPLSGQTAITGVLPMQDTDIFYVVRGSTDYKMTWAELKAQLNLNELSGIVEPSQGGLGLDPSFDTGDPEAARNVMQAAGEDDVVALSSRLDTVEAAVGITEAVRITYRVLDDVNSGDWRIRDDDHNKAIYVNVGVQDKDIELQAHGSIADDDLYLSGTQVQLLTGGSGDITVSWDSNVWVDGVQGPGSITLRPHVEVAFRRYPATNWWALAGAYD